MNVKEYFLSPTTKIAEDYLMKDEAICSFFDYHYAKPGVYKARLNELLGRTFSRDFLVQAIRPFLSSLRHHEMALHNLEKLSQANTVAVVGGQQPGLLTGPLYTIYKAMTIIQLAKEQERELGHPVVPIFWIAGEDHDFDEINHLFVFKENEMNKHVFSIKEHSKVQLSDLEINKLEMENWIRGIFRTYKETEYTKDLLVQVQDLLQHSSTFVDFFAQILSWLFKEDGLILLNSADPNIRKLEGEMFAEIIENNEQISAAFNEKINSLVNLGYPKPIELLDDHANLFFLDGGKREKILRSATHSFTVGKHLYSKKELKEIALSEPERFSNNVVTRPVMQEYLLPVLAFVGGPGEIAYWSSLQDVFHQFSYKVPPLVPRLSITLFEDKIMNWMQEFGVSEEDIFTNHLMTKKEQWYQTKKQWDIKSQGEITKALIEKAHEPLQNMAGEMGSNMKQIAEKNVMIISKQIDFLTKRLEKEVRGQHDQELRKFDSLEMILRPKSNPQERAYNIFYYMNLYGVDFHQKLAESKLIINERHKLIYL